MDEKVYNAIVKAIATQKHIDGASIERESTLEQLGISSLDAITIVYEIEEQFDVEVPNDALENLKTVQDIVDGIGALVAAKA
ncbi:MAG TPA: histidine kinase [Sedimenticola thiotaurini]|uniref:Histidine kinase n=1 Tax=Sedimenticola thiotaurini TaxID=1543721 RepID=A0A831RJM7_9GAMM|nr:histidine kinase [Sedimenticola thiotaurini]